MDRKDGRSRVCSVRQASRGNDGYEVEKRYCTTTRISQCSQEEGPGRPSGPAAPGGDPGHHQEAPTHPPQGQTHPACRHQLLCPSCRPSCTPHPRSHSHKISSPVISQCGSILYAIQFTRPDRGVHPVSLTKTSREQHTVAQVPFFLSSCPSTPAWYFPGPSSSLVGITLLTCGRRSGGLPYSYMGV